MPKRFYDTKGGGEVEVVDPKDFVFVKTPGGVRIVPADQLEEIKGDIRVRQKHNGVEYNGYTLEKSGDVVEMGFGRLDPVRGDKHEYVKPPESAAAEPKFKEGDDSDDDKSGKKRSK